MPQGRLWRARVSKVRGAEYVTELERFYGLLPYVVATPDFVACHAGPPLDRVSRDRIIEIHRYPNLRHQMTWNRVQRAGHPAGYGKREVKTLRKAVGLSGRSPLIVSHQPKQGEATVWMGFENVKKHHVVYSARRDKIGVFTRIRGEMVPLVYPADALSVLLR